MKLEDMLAYKVAMLASDLSESLASEYAEYKLTVPEWRILATLGATGDSSSKSPLTAKELAAATRLDKVQVSRALERLVKRDAIHKRSCEDDKRATLISLSMEGKAIYRALLPKIVCWQNKRLENITDDEYQIFLKVIDALRP
ncbi:MarR family transcriptional regulator [Alteromonas sp. BL110]|uniref:MarR family winged helix-turn-helix transcriptional regulator n=1 Tax=Alteromonas sp. BL110 TaxID=1714845 RepID=UPI000E50CC20|nr:MarR family transcriptional regulator [Alteromonas sp. BL110]AXT37280.1 MarR family transcriptional regulator [Alteromonas sp. BL110]RKM80018.1 MarR family transcriptional regulator [Alteromonas sp. BL110]